MYPLMFVAGAIALYFIGTAVQRPRPAVIVAAILWAAYAVYEYFIANGTLCDTNCNIRVDLILFWPLLAIATWAACNTPAQRPIVKKVFAVLAVLFLALLVAPLAYIALFGFPQDAPQSTPPPRPTSK